MRRLWVAALTEKLLLGNDEATHQFCHRFSD
jgi:hypothetical protein